MERFRGVLLSVLVGTLDFARVSVTWLCLVRDEVGFNSVSLAGLASASLGFGRLVSMRVELADLADLGDLADFGRVILAPLAFFLFTRLAFGLRRFAAFSCARAIAASTERAAQAVISSRFSSISAGTS